MSALLMSLLACADPVALRSPAQGDAVVAVGAPTLGVAWRGPEDWGADDLRPTIGVHIRLPSAATDLSAGLSLRRGDDEGWGWAVGASAGAVLTRDPAVGLSLSPWARVERRGGVHGGAQLAIPMAVASSGQARVPLVSELFIGSQRGPISVLAVGGVGWAFAPGTPSGAFVAQGSLQMGLAVR